jgi:predicted nucleic acid-binding protein
VPADLDSADPDCADVASAYVDSCVLLSLFLGDSGYEDGERWLLSQRDQTLWISHWVLLEFAGVIATCRRRGQLTAEQAQAIGAEFERFRQERLTLIEPRGADFLQARQWLERSDHLPLRSGDALHLALAQRHQLLLVTADRALVRCAESLGLPTHVIG